MNIKDFHCVECDQDWSEDSTATGPQPPRCPACDPKAARHRAIREQTRRRLAETKSDSVLSDAVQVACPSRLEVARAIKALGRAQGRVCTSQCARDLAVQSLAWSLALNVGMDNTADNVPA